MLKREKGITLIALVVTIIVLLILAAVSLSMLTGENGILINAKKSVNKTKSGSILERLELALTEYQTRKHFIKEEEKKTVLQGILKKIEGVENVTYDEENKKFTVVIEDETFLVDLDGNYEKRNITIKVDKQKVESGMQLSIQIITKDEIEKIELIKEGTSTTLEAINNGSNYTCEKTVTEEGNYQIKVTTETEEETINIVIDLGGPEIVHSFNQETNEINMTVTDNGSGISKIQVYQQTSETTTSAITEKTVEEFSYEEAPISKDEISKITEITFGHYLREYKIIATDVDGNETTVEHIFTLPIQTYIIMNEAQLKQFRDSVNIGKNNFSGKTVYLGADIELNKGKYTLDETGRIPTFSSEAEAWIPINANSYADQFQGVFDGQGYIISGLYINTTAGFQGLFASMRGTVRRVGIVKSNYTCGAYSGGIVGEGNDNRGIVESCFFSGRISGNGNDSIGGIVGRETRVRNCYFDGETRNSVRRDCWMV